jgi:hypothetical protein
MLFLFIAPLGCVSDEALRRVEIGTARPSRTCELVAERIEARGEDEARAQRTLRKRAYRQGANYVVVQETKSGWDPWATQTAPWTYGRVVIVVGEAYYCPGELQPEPARVLSED